MNSPKISVIIPVYNMGQYLDQSIESWTAQTLKDIEIILINDASTDNSFDVLQKWTKKDSRIVLHSFSENQSAWTARKWGIMAAKGEYIMFGDADDTISPEACEELYSEMRRDPVDILHFNSVIVNVNHLPDDRIEYMTRFLAPYKGELKGEDVLTACFRDGKYRFTLWNKVYSTELCKEVFKTQENAVLPVGEDKLTYFILAFSANSYRGIAGKAYYTYFFGRGSTGNANMTYHQFERYCTLAHVAKKMEDFLKSQNVHERYRDIAEKFRKELFDDCYARWNNEIEEVDKARCFDLLARYWETDEVITAIARTKYNQQFMLAKQLIDAEKLRYDKRRIKTIATYYHSIVNGGAQRVVCNLCHLWVEMGYRVILYTDYMPNQNDYILPESVKRIVLPNFREINHDNYRERAKLLYHSLQENEIDLFVYHAWISHLLLWDELTIKTAGVTCIVHCHSVFSLGMRYPWTKFQNIAAPYLLADGVVTLSAVDSLFWKHFNTNVFDVINPFTGTKDEWKQSDCDGHDILWLGRLDDEKRPFDALEIMRIVADNVPDARLHIVGESNIEGFMEAFNQRIAELKLQDHVIQYGFQSEVRPYYEKASVFLMTSEFEGFGLTLQESFLSGLPCVMYELPYLTLVRGNGGIVSVRQGDIREAAKQLIFLLQNDIARREKGKKARAFIEGFKEYDFPGRWEQIFNSLYENHSQVDDITESMMETLVLHHDIGLEKLRNDGRYNGRKMVRAAILLTKGKDAMAEQGLGYALSKAVKKIWNHFVRR